MELARQAVELSAHEGAYWNTLGVSEYAAGNWHAAISALEKSCELTKGGSAFDWFSLAMAHWRLENSDEGRSWFEKGVKWMDAHAKDNEELGRFRAEAAALLGIRENSMPANEMVDAQP